jgi:DNA-binding NtrC family response regulator
MVASLAQTTIPVLIVGESGTGKGVYANRLHQLSTSVGSFERINCASMDEGQIREGRAAIVRTAKGIPLSAIYLDGIHELGPAMQKYLLALLDSREVAQNLRIISSAPPEIERDVEAGRFRGELYFRLRGAHLRLPPLRNRKEDIPALLEHFLSKHKRAVNGLSVGPTELEMLTAYDWPGNIRELENLVKKMIAVGSTCIDAQDFPRAAAGPDIRMGSVRTSPLKVAARKALRRAERELILDALARTHWNRKKAAQALQISYKSLLYKIKQIGADLEESPPLERS